MLAVLVDADPIALWGLIVAIIGVVVGLVAAVAAIYAAVYAKAAPTKEDLAQVAENTATTASHVEKVRAHMFNMDVRQQEELEQESLRETARHISIHVDGAYGNAGPMILRFITQNATVVLLHAQLRNELGSSFGHADCAQTGPQEFSANFSVLDIQKWYESATKTDMQARRVLTIRAHLRFGQQVADRDITTWVQKSQFPLFTVEGNC